jgi:murein DD-endopeptidase MepM/ murein hydrolase activator NlpD
MRLVEPWPDGYTVNKRSPYGPRVHPITGKRTFHHGVDVALPVGTPLTAPAPGVVVHKNRTDSAGFNLIIRHEGTWHTVYYHLQKPSHLLVNARVQTGDLIAYSGNTGASTGPHLHWELRKTRTWGDTVNPMDYVVEELSEESEPVIAGPEAPQMPETITPQPPKRPAPPSRPVMLPKPFKPTPMSAGLARFFTIRRNLK